MNHIAFFLSLFMSTSLLAQVDVKTDLISNIAQRANLEAELILKQRYGIGIAGFADYGKKLFARKVSKSGYRFMLLGRRYLKTNAKGDKLFLGIYGGARGKIYSEVASDGTDLGYNFSQNLVGGNLGYKWRWDNRFLLEADLFMGKTFSDGTEYNDPDASARIFEENFDIDAWCRISVGYRLLGKM